jgi:hypothetical protein
MFAFQLRMDNIWFCKLLLHFKILTKTDAGMVYHDCANVSVLEEYKCRRRPAWPGIKLHILHLKYYFAYLIFITILSMFCIFLVINFLVLHSYSLLDECQSTIVHERRESAQVLCRESIRKSFQCPRYWACCLQNRDDALRNARWESVDFPGAFCEDKTKDWCDGCRWWWYFNSCDLAWGAKQWRNNAETPQKDLCFHEYA